jgi:hypothetical protein
MSDDPIGDAARAARRRHRVPEGSACVYCGEQDPALLEKHHIAGVGNLPDLTVWHCKNCHAKQHVDLADAGVDLAHPPRRFVLEVVAVVLVACAVLFRGLADTFVWLAHLLRECIASLDREAPNWRAIPEAAM